MNITAVIPAKRFDRAKSRLAPALPERAREELARAMLVTVLEAVRDSHQVARIVVVTDCEEVSAVAARYGAEIVPDPPGGLGVSVQKTVASIAGADAVLVLMGDLPHLAAAEVSRLAAALALSPVVIAPDRQREGTNALGLRLPAIIEPAFGRYGSFDEHLRRLRAAGCEPIVVESEGLAFDVDAPADLELLSRGRAVG